MADDEKDLSGFIGVSDIYKNYADDTTKPFFSEDEDLRKAEEAAQEAEAATEVPLPGTPGKAREESKDSKSDDSKSGGGGDDANTTTTTRAPVKSTATKAKD